MLKFNFIHFRYNSNFNTLKLKSLVKDIANSLNAKFIVTADGDGQHDSIDIKNI